MECSQVYAFIEIPSFAALICSNSSDSIYLVKTEEKGICENMTCDLCIHIASEGEKNLKRKYLQKVGSKKQFLLINKDVFVAPDEIFQVIVVIVERSKIGLNM